MGKNGQTRKDKRVAEGKWQLGKLIGIADAHLRRLRNSRVCEASDGQPQEGL